MEHEIHSVYSLFWRNAYVAALQAGHQDPAAAADEAFMAFDCRFGEVQKEPDFNTFFTKEVTAIEKEIVENAGNEFIPHHGWAKKTDPSTEGLPAYGWKADDEVLG